MHFFANFNFNCSKNKSKKTIKWSSHKYLHFGLFRPNVGLSSQTTLKCYKETQLQQNSVEFKSNSTVLFFWDFSLEKLYLGRAFGMFYTFLGSERSWGTWLHQKTKIKVSHSEPPRLHSTSPSFLFLSPHDELSLSTRMVWDGGRIVAVDNHHLLHHHAPVRRELPVSYVTLPLFFFLSLRFQESITHFLLLPFLF